MSVTTGPGTQIEYPDSDGEPMADNTLQFQYIVMIKEGLEALFADDPDVFIAGDLLWYTVQGNNRLRMAPDAMVAFGRPKGHRGSYRQWEENNIPPQVVFEILSPGNRAGEMTNKYLFYSRHGVEEYYLYDPDHGELAGWLRDSATGALDPIENMVGWISPRLGIRFDLSETELVLYRPDGERFKRYTELLQERDAERERADQAEERAARLAERLRELGVDPDTL